MNQRKSLSKSIDNKVNVDTSRSSISVSSPGIELADSNGTRSHCKLRQVAENEP